MSSALFLEPAATLASESAELLRNSEADAFSANPLSMRAAEPWLHRSRTAAQLRCYLRFSIEVRRLPSILGRELFRSKVMSYRMSSFENAVIFVYYVERALAQLNAFGQLLIGTIIFQEYTQDEAAEHLRCAPNHLSGISRSPGSDLGAFSARRTAQPASLPTCGKW
jgi:hypothetical protein